MKFSNVTVTTVMADIKSQPVLDLFWSLGTVQGTAAAGTTGLSLPDYPEILANLTLPWIWHLQD